MSSRCNPSLALLLACALPLAGCGGDPSDPDPAPQPGHDLGLSDQGPEPRDLEYGADLQSDLGPGADEGSPQDDLGQAQPCSAASPCGPGYWCDPRSETCRFGCRSDANCDVAQRCNLETLRCEDLGGCEDDALEENDSAEQAAPVDPGPLSLRLCPGDGDWLSMPLAAAEQLRIVLTHAGTARVEGTIEGPDGTLLASGYSAEGRLELAGAASSAGIHRVHLRSEATTRVDCELELLREPACIEDALEPDDIPEEAVDLLDGENPPRKICPGDEDWHRVTLGVWERSRVRLLAEPGAPLTFELFDAAGQRVASADWDAELGRGDLVYGSEAGGVYTLRLQGERASDYRMVLERNPGDLCQQDPQEENDSAEEAPLLQAGRWEGLSICRGDDDWFAPELHPWDQLHLEVTSQQLAALDVSLVDADSGAVLREAQLEGQRWVLDHGLGADDAPPLLRVRLSSGFGASYAVAIAIDPAPSCEEDLFEDNDTPEQALPAALEPMELSLCVGDDDWFELEAVADQTVEAEAQWDQGGPNAAVTLELWAPGAGAPLQRSAPAAGRATLSYTPREDRLLQLRVSLSGAAALGYRLELRGQREPEPPPCEPDAYEEDDSVEAARLYDPLLDGQTLCFGDEDWQWVDLAPDDVLRVWLQHPPGAGPVRLHLRDEEGEIETQDSANGLLLLDSLAPAGGRRYVGLELRSREPLAYDLSLELRRPEPCIDDLTEDDDEAATALPLLGSGPQVLCPGDDDWRSLELQEGETLHLAPRFPTVGAGLELTVLGPDDSVLAQVQGAAPPPRVTLLAPTSGTYRIGLHSLALQRQGLVLDWSVDPPSPPACEADAAEPNQSWIDCPLLEPGVVPDLLVCLVDEDWYRIAAQAGDRLTVRAPHDARWGELALELLGPSAWPPLAEAQSGDEAAALEAVVGESGDQVLRVRALSGEVVPYHLEIDRQPRE